jgi:hypothetical protein
MYNRKSSDLVRTMYAQVARWSRGPREDACLLISDVPKACASKREGPGSGRLLLPVVIVGRKRFIVFCHKMTSQKR